MLPGVSCLEDFIDVLRFKTILFLEPNVYYLELSKFKVSRLYCIFTSLNRRGTNFSFGIDSSTY